MGGQAGGEARVEDRRADRLALAGGVPVVQRLHGTDREEVAVAEVTHRCAEERTTAATAATVLPLLTAEGGAHLVGAGQVLRGSHAVEPSALAVDDAGVDGAEVVVPDAETLGDTPAHVVGDDVGLPDHPVQRARPSGVWRSRQTLRLPRLAI